MRVKKFKSEYDEKGNYVGIAEYWEDRGPAYNNSISKNRATKRLLKITKVHKPVRKVTHPIRKDPDKWMSDVLARWAKKREERELLKNGRHKR